MYMRYVILVVCKACDMYVVHGCARVGHIGYVVCEVWCMWYVCGV